MNHKTLPGRGTAGVKTLAGVWQSNGGPERSRQVWEGCGGGVGGGVREGVGSVRGAPQTQKLWLFSEGGGGPGELEQVRHHLLRANRVARAVALGIDCGAKWTWLGGPYRDLGGP